MYLICPIQILTLGLEVIKVSKGAKIMNRYNQVPHLTEDTIENVINLSSFLNSNKAQ